LLQVFTAAAQDYSFTHYQVEDGLSNNAVLNIIQDHKGFIWFGTRDGLNRFDGLSFKVFRNDPTSPKSIGSNAIMSLCEDDQQQIWVGTEKGLFIYNELTESFTQFKTAGNASIFSVKVKNGELWYVSLYTLYRYNLATKAIKHFEVGGEVTSYCLMKNGGLCVATATGKISFYDSARDKFKAYDVFNKSPYTVSKSIGSIHETGDGTMLIGTSNQGLKSFDINSGTYTDLLSFNPDKTDIIVRDLLTVHTGEYWIATQSGIYILRMHDKSFINLRKQYNDPYSLSDNIVHTLCMDKEGGIWAGTYFGGVNYYPKNYLRFTKYYPKFGSNSISGNAVREISADKYGCLWIGTEDAGLNRLDISTGKFTQFNPGITQQSVSYSNIHGLLVDGDYIWAGTYLHGLDLLDVRTGKRARHYNTGNSSLGSNFVYSLYKTSKGKLIAATDKGLYEYLPSTDNFNRVTKVPSVFYRNLGEDTEGNLWAGTYGDGVFVYNDSTGLKAHYLGDILHKDSLPADLVNYIFKDSRGTMWLATENGLCRFDANKKAFKRYSIDNGFPANVIYAMKEDGKHRLWVSTSKGLVRFDPTTENIKVYTRSQGLLTDQFNYNSAYKDASGRMYFGSVKGMISFNPDAAEENNFVAPVYITGFQVYNQELGIGGQGSPLKQSITYTDKLTLKHNQSSFSIDFAALGFSSPAGIQYAYKMDGLDKDWTYLKTNRKAFFTELKPGDYTFRVKTFNSSTMPGGNSASLQITILPPFWLTWWAYLVYLLLTALIVYFITRYFTDRAKERNRRKLEKLAFEKEKENYEDKLNFFTNVAHEIRTPLTLIKGPMENIMDRIDEVPAIRGNLQIMNRNTERLLQLTTQLLDFRKTEMHGFRLNYIETDITGILLETIERFKPMADQKPIDIKLHYPDILIAQADPEALNKIFSNLVDNAIKYAKSNVSLSLAVITKSEESFYRLTIKNDGYLIPYEMHEKIFESFFRVRETSDQSGTGIGLTLCLSLAQLHGGTLMLLPPCDQMNIFELTLPVLPAAIDTSKNQAH